MIQTIIKKGMNLWVRRVNSDSSARPLREGMGSACAKTEGTRYIHCKHANPVEHPEDDKSAMAEPIDDKKDRREADICR